MIEADWPAVVDVDMDEVFVEELERRAGSMGFLTEEYCALVLANWLNSGKELARVKE